MKHSIEDTLIKNMSQDISDEFNSFFDALVSKDDSIDSKLAKHLNDEFDNLMNEVTINIDCEEVPLNKAFDIMTDEWIDDENYSAKTLLDTRDALAKMIELYRDSIDDMAKIIKEVNDKIKPLEKKQKIQDALDLHRAMGL